MLHQGVKCIVVRSEFNNFKFNNDESNILFAMLGLSLKAFSQGKPTVPNGQVPFNYTIKNSMQERLEKCGIHTNYDPKINLTA